jgi:two-component system, response regulator RegA
LLNSLCLKSHRDGTSLTTQKPRLLIVEDDAGFSETLRLEFEERGYDVFVAHSVAELSRAASETIRFAVVDLRIGQDSGLHALGKIKELFPECRVVLLTGYGSIATAVQAMKLGASNYLTKPVAIEVLEKALWVDLSEESALGTPEERTSLARHEREYIEYVLNQCEGNITRAANWLGVHRQSLQRKLRKYPPRK